MTPAEFCTPDVAVAGPPDPATVKRWLQLTGRKQKTLAAELAVLPSIVCQWLQSKLSHRRQRSLADAIAMIMAAEGALSPNSAAASAAMAAPPRKLARTDPQRSEPPPPNPPYVPQLPYSHPSLLQHSSALSTPAACPSATGHFGGDVDCGDEEVTIVREVSSGARSILQTAPHGRDQCEIEPLWRCMEQPTRCCALCYCVLCDAPVASCPAWEVHCRATFKGPTAQHWRALRRELAEARGTAKRKQGSILDWLGGGGARARVGGLAAGQSREEPSAAVASAPSAEGAEAKGEDIKPFAGVAQWMQVRLCVLPESASDELIGLEVAARPEVLHGGSTQQCYPLLIR